MNVLIDVGYRSAREHYTCTHRSGGVDAAIRLNHSRPTDDARSIAADSSGRRPSSRREASQKSDCREVAPDVKSHPIPRDKASTGPGYMRADGTLPL